MKLKYIEDYYDEVHKYIPDLTKDDYTTIATRGFMLLHIFCRWGADVYMRSKKWGFNILFGKLYADSQLYWRYQNIKWRIKCRLTYYSERKPWDGKYYFALNEEEYKKYIPKKSGRYKNKIEIPKVLISKIREEFNFYYYKKYVFCITGLEDMGIGKYIDISSRNITLVSKRDSNNIMQPIDG